MQSSKKSFDAIIIGAGQSGIPLAHDLAEAGWQVALIERHLVGGSCLNYGCTPTKTMIASAHLAHRARRAQEYGVHLGQVKVDLKEVIKRKDEVVESFRGSSEERLEESPDIQLIRGEASFLSAHEIEVDLEAEPTKRQLAAEVIVINSGARPRWPNISGIGQVNALTSTSIMELDELPDHLIILGGGYVGLEFGQMFRRFGSQVTIIQRGQQLLNREDADIAEEIAEIMRDEGIEIQLNAEVNSVSRTDQGRLQVEFTLSGQTRTVSGSHLLLAAGRVPNIEALNLEAAGVALDESGHIRVDDQLATNVDGVYATGDVKGGPAFTHISYDDYRVLAANLLNGAEETIAGRLVPYTVFIDPQLGRVGITEKQAKRAGINYKVASMPMSYVARAIEVGETRGRLKALVDADTKQILGVAFLGIEAGELMSAAQLAMQGELPYTHLQQAIFAHPTLAESFNNLFATLD